MPTYECSACGYSCGSGKAWLRHTERMSTDSQKHELSDPGLLETLKTVNVPAARDLLSRSMRSLEAWADSVERVSVEKKVVSCLEHGIMPLIDAARRDNVSKVEQLLKGPDYDTAQDAVTQMVAKSHRRLINKTDAAGMSAIAWAAKRGNCEIIRALLKANASPDLSLLSHDDFASDPHPPLYLALVRGKADAARLLLDHGANPAEAEPVRRQTALHAAVSTALIPSSMLEELIERTTTRGRSFPADVEGCTALHTAAATGQLESIQVFMRHPSFAQEVCRHSLKRVSPLAAACRRGHVEVARALAACGAPIDPKVVHICAVKGQTELLAELIETERAGSADAGAGGAVAGSDAACGKAGGVGQGGGAGGVGQDGEVDGEAGGERRRRTDGVGINCQFREDGVSALMMAAEAGEEAAARSLLEMDADASLADHDGHTALMRAAFKGHGALVGALIEAGAAVDAVDLAGNSALHHAGRSCQEFIFDLLELKHGADSSLLNHKGEAPKVAAEPCRVS